MNGTDSWVMNNANIDLSGYAGQTVYLSFGAAWGLNTGDHALVQISANGGTSWTTIHDQASDGYIYYWSRYRGEIPNAFKTAHFRIRFRLTSNNSAVYWGFLIDDVGIGTTLTYSYESWDGTSMATPHVAGAVGLMASVFPNETVSQRKKRILDNGDAKASLAGRSVTGRRLNLYNSITAAAPAPNPAIRVTSPDGGEVWLRNTVHNITWTSEGTVGNVNLHYSTDGGTSWTLIAGNEANDGVYFVDHSCRDLSYLPGAGPGNRRQPQRPERRGFFHRHVREPRPYRFPPRPTVRPPGRWARTSPMSPAAPNQR